MVQLQIADFYTKKKKFFLIFMRAWVGKNNGFKNSTNILYANADGKVR
jgi:hypothetical protein